jgi:hypothetical protein
VSRVGEAAPLEPTTGAAGAVAAALDATPWWPRERDEAELLAACRAERDLPQALAAVDLALWDLAGKRAGRPVSELISVEAARSIRSTRRSAPRTARARPPAAAAAAQADFDTSRSRSGSATTRAGSRRCARRSGRGWRSGSTQRRLGVDEASPRCARWRRGIELAEEPVHGVARCGRCGARSTCRWRWTRPRPRYGAGRSGATTRCA